MNGARVVTRNVVATIRVCALQVSVHSSKLVVRVAATNSRAARHSVWRTEQTAAPASPRTSCVMSASQTAPPPHSTTPRLQAASCAPGPAGTQRKCLRSAHRIVCAPAEGSAGEQGEDAARGTQRTEQAGS
jgi:hypothetical protein